MCHVAPHRVGPKPRKNRTRRVGPRRMAQTSTFKGVPLHKNHQNSTRRHPEREKKERIYGRREKERNFGPPPPFGPHPSGPPSGLPPLRAPTPSGPHHPTAQPAPPPPKKKGQMRFGQMRSRPLITSIGHKWIGQKSAPIKHIAPR